MLNLQNLGHLIQRADSLDKTLMLEKMEDKRRRGRQRMRWLDNLTDSMGKNMSILQEIVKYRNPGMLQSMRSQRVRHDLATEHHQFSASIFLNEKFALPE